jgi:hypothetical protein
MSFKKIQNTRLLYWWPVCSQMKRLQKLFQYRVPYQTRWAFLKMILILAMLQSTRAHVTELEISLLKERNSSRSQDIGTMYE